MKIGITVGVVIAILALVVCLVPLNEVAYTATVDYQDTETYYETEPYEDTETYYETEPLEYRELDSFIGSGGVNEEWIKSRAVMYGYDLPDQIMEGSGFALYIAVQNLDDVPGTFEIRYTLTTADKNAAERQKWLHQRTPEEYAELKREYYEGSIKLYLEPGEARAAICPLGGIYIAPDRVPFGHEHEIIPDTKSIEKQRTVTKYRQVEKERTVTKQRPETRYKKVSLLDYLLHY